jgi:hypothetical protein
MKCKRCSEKSAILDGYCRSCAIVTIPKKYMKFRDAKPRKKLP